MIVDDFDVLGVASTPSEADSKLIIDSNTKLPFSFATQHFQTIAWRDTQILKFFRIIDPV